MKIASCYRVSYLVVPFSLVITSLANSLIHLENKILSQEILCLDFSNNQRLQALFPIDLPSTNIAHQELEEMKAWEIKYQAIQIILRYTNIKNNTTFEAMLLHYLSGIFLSADCIQNVIDRLHNLACKTIFTHHKFPSDYQRVFEFDSKTIETIYVATQEMLITSRETIDQIIYHRYMRDYGPLKNDQQQSHPETDKRSLQNIFSAGLSFSIPKRYRAMIAEMYKQNSTAILSDLLKNEKIVTMNGLTHSKISLMVHDIFDHYWLSTHLFQLGYCEKFSTLFKKIGSPFERDVFSREGELIASIAFEYRLYLISHDYTPLLSMRDIAAILEQSIKEGLATENQYDALALLQSSEYNKGFLHGLSYIYSGIIIELMEQRRKNGLIKIINPDTRDIIGTFNALDPEYLAFIIHTCSWLFSNTQLIHQALLTIAVITENYLCDLAKNPDIAPLRITLENIKDAIPYDGSIPDYKITWFKKNPGFASTRSILSQ